FDLIEKLALQTRAGDEDVEIQGARASLRITATVRADAKDQPVVAAKINLRLGGRGGPESGALKGLAELRPGELLAIGQSSLTDKLWQFPSPTDKLSTDSSAGAQQLYYIVRASL